MAKRIDLTRNSIAAAAGGSVMGSFFGVVGSIAGAAVGIVIGLLISPYNKHDDTENKNTQPKSSRYKPANVA